MLHERQRVPAKRSNSGANKNNPARRNVITIRIQWSTLVCQLFFNNIMHLAKSNDKPLKPQKGSNKIASNEQTQLDA